MPARISHENLRRLMRVRTKIAMLPSATERLRWHDLLRQKLGPVADERLSIIVGDELPLGHPARAAAATAELIRNQKSLPQETDLKVANWLDNVYTAVADRVEIVGSKAANAVEVTGWSLWPLVIAGIGIVWIMSNRNRAAAGG